MSNYEIKTRADDRFVPSYARHPLTMVSGNGCMLEDAEGKQYLDFLAGIAVCVLGHAHPSVTEALCRQAGELVHASNLFYNPVATELAEMLCGLSFAEKVFITNSGAEANEAALKLARLAGGPERYEVISLLNSFHGRTLATVAATGQAKCHQGFEPLPAGFISVAGEDEAALKKAITPHTCAVICEPIQGEGGVLPLSSSYLKLVRELCDRHNLLLIFDEIQTGMGRTGTMFAYEQLGVVPDVMTLAKGLGNGVPIGAMLTSNRYGILMAPGTHGSTFGGNPLAAAAAVATLRVITADGFLSEVKRTGEYLSNVLTDLGRRFPDLVTHERGMGLMRGLVLSERGAEHGADIVADMLAKGVIINFTGATTLRFVPPLIVSTAQIDRMAEALAEVLTAKTG
jgi:acetylornithine/N-succinyldiaminopimelate aminotransferase